MCSAHLNITAVVRNLQSVVRELDFVRGTKHLPAIQIVSFTYKRNNGGVEYAPTSVDLTDTLLKFTRGFRFFG
jgi:hypothetical protein